MLGFADAFFFSIETLATVGYGEMYPAMLYGHVVVAAEIVCGLAFTAILASPSSASRGRRPSWSSLPIRWWRA
jgi:hypothetical protein